MKDGIRKTVRNVAVAGICLAGCGIGLLLLQPKEDPELLWKRAETDFLAGRWDRAEAGLAQLAKLRPPAPGDWMLRAQLAMARGKVDDALADLREVPDRDYWGAKARLLAGQMELRRHRLRAAEAALLQATRVDPGSIQAHRELIYIYGVQLRRAAFDKQFRMLSELTALSIENTFHWGLMRSMQWDPREGVKTMTRALQADPDDRWSRLSLVESLREVHQLDRAEEMLRPLPDNDSEARVLRVRLALDRSDVDGAERLLNETAINHPQLFVLKGRLALSRRDAAAALRSFRAAEALEPDNRDALSGLVTTLRMLGEKDAAKPIGETVQNMDRLAAMVQRLSIPSNRNAPEMLRQLGKACEAVDRLPEARTWYNLAIARDPLDKSSQQALARINERLMVAKTKPGS